MTALHLVLSILLAGSTLLGQVSNAVVFANSPTNLVRFDSDPAKVRARDTPGAPVAGASGVWVALFCGPLGTTAESSLAPVTGLSVPVQDGRYNGGTVVVPLPLGEAGAVFQVRAWEASYGATYDLALSGGGYTGKTPLFMRTWPGVPPGPIPLAAPEFSIGLIPEPSAVLLGVAGAVILLWRRRKSVN